MLDIAVDNSILSNYAAKRVDDPDLSKDKKAFEEMISLAQQGIIELGGPWTTLKIENLMKSGECRTNVQKLSDVVKDWPVPDPDPRKADQQTACLHGIMQDPSGIDSRQLVLISRCTQARHFVTVDYRFYHRFNDRKKDIANQCGIYIFVMRPLDFMRDWEAGKI